MSRNNLLHGVVLLPVADKYWGSLFELSWKSDRQASPKQAQHNRVLLERGRKSDNCPIQQFLEENKQLPQ